MLCSSQLTLLSQIHLNSEIKQIIPSWFPLLFHATFCRETFWRPLFFFLPIVHYIICHTLECRPSTLMVVPEQTDDLRCHSFLSQTVVFPAFPEILQECVKKFPDWRLAGTTAHWLKYGCCLAVTQVIDDYQLRLSIITT